MYSKFAIGTNCSPNPQEAKSLMAAAKVCLIGAGPSGMSVLYQLERLRQLGDVTDLPEVTCYEKQDDWGGLWNYTWRTGLDEFGQSVHGSMYQNLWSNVPKEVMEYDDYPFDDHFGKATPSYMPREVMLHYLCGRWNKHNLKQKVAFQHAVHSVTFDAARNKFSVTVKDLKNDKLIENREFDYVVNCTGHYSFPNVPHFKGMDKFPGRLMHAHDLRGWSEFSGKRTLVIGSSFTAEDVALQLFKHGASQVICSYRTRPLGFQWPDAITERPLLIEVDGQVARFLDGTSAEIDVIILATGYLHHYPYLPDSLRLTGKNLLYPANLYKCIVWLGAGNERMLYIGAQNQCYSFPMFDAQALWTIKYICGDIKLPDRAVMEAEVQKWQERQAALKDFHEFIDFQTDCLLDLGQESGYGSDLDRAKWFHEWLRQKSQDILTYRDKSFVSKATGAKAPDRAVAFMVEMNDSMNSFVANGQ